MDYSAGTEMNNSQEMKYVFVDVESKWGRVRIGSCAVWVTAIIVLACTGHLLLAAPASLPLLWRQIRGG
jgi:hypothetical protein